MSNLLHLIDRYAEHPALERLLHALAQNPAARLQLTGMVGAQEAFLLAAAAHKLPVRHVYIANSKEEAAYRLNDLQALLSDEQVRFFPDSFKRPAFFDDIHPTQVLQRSQVAAAAPPAAPPGPPMRGGAVTLGISSDSVERPGGELDAAPPLMGGPGGAIVTYPEALFEKVVRPDVLGQHRIEVTKGARLDMDFVMEILVEYGFERTDFVYEPGQFSLRGGIVDLFSYGHDLPYRIELFDDEVESIRVFDPVTQLSKQSLAQLSIVPNLNSRFQREQKASLLEVLPPGTVLWIKDLQFLLDRLQYCFDKAEQYAHKVSALDAAELREIFRDRAFLYPGEVLESLQHFPVVFLEKQGANIERLLEIKS